MQQCSSELGGWEEVGAGEWDGVRGDSWVRGWGGGGYEKVGGLLGDGSISV